MTTPDYSAITDTSRPRPVRISAFVGAAMTAALAVLTATEVWPPAVTGSLLGLVTIGSLAGWLFVEQKVTPTSSPATRLDDGTLTRLLPDTTPPRSKPPQSDPPNNPPIGGLGLA